MGEYRRHTHFCRNGSHNCQQHYSQQIIELFKGIQIIMVRKYWTLSQLTTPKTLHQKRFDLVIC